MRSAYDMGWFTVASTAFLIFSMEAKAFLQSLFSGRSSSNRMEPFAPFFLPTTWKVPASWSASLMYSEYGRSMLAKMVGSTNLRYCCWALPLSPPLVVL